MDARNPPVGGHLAHIRAHDDCTTHPDIPQDRMRPGRILRVPQIELKPVEKESGATADTQPPFDQLSQLLGMRLRKPRTNVRPTGKYHLPHQLHVVAENNAYRVQIGFTRLMEVRVALQSDVLPVNPCFDDERTHSGQARSRIAGIIGPDMPRQNAVTKLELVAVKRLFVLENYRLCIRRSYRRDVLETKSLGSTRIGLSAHLPSIPDCCINRGTLL